MSTEGTIYDIFLENWFVYSANEEIKLKFAMFMHNVEELVVLEATVSYCHGNVMKCHNYPTTPTDS